MGLFLSLWNSYLEVVMQIFLKASDALCVEASPEDKVSSLKVQLLQSGYNVNDLVLSQNGRSLDDDLTLVQCGINDLSTVEVFNRVVGGKVHGSLARAGKVKGQTPKVDPQEKKKKKTGRAARRIQYNRRFVNVVQTFGRRRGPNANAA